MRWRHSAEVFAAIAPSSAPSASLFFGLRKNYPEPHEGKLARGLILTPPLSSIVASLPLSYIQEESINLSIRIEYDMLL